MQSSLLATITPPRLRPAAFAQQRVVANVGLGLGGFAGGLIVTTTTASTFTTLFLVNSASFVVYTLFVSRIPLAGRAEIRRVPRGYRVVVRDGAFMRFAAIHLLFVITTVSMLNSLFPVFAKNEAGVSETSIGLFFLLNSMLIMVFQLPVTRASAGHRRMRTFAATGALFALCWLLVFAGGEASTGAVAVVLLAATLVSITLLFVARARARAEELR
jgi:hypothetical protein